MWITLIPSNGYTVSVRTHLFYPPLVTNTVTARPSIHPKSIQTVHMITALIQSIMAKKNPKCNDEENYFYPELRKLHKIKLIGMGAHGKVFIAKDESGLICACKSINMHRLGIEDTEVLGREIGFFHTLTNASKDVRKFFINANFIFMDAHDVHIAMEFAPGGDFMEFLIRRGNLSYGECAFYGKEIAQGLQHMHDRNFAHRDVKPDNLMLDVRGNIKITDFGFAKKVSDRTWTLCGTPEYLAPEIIQVNAE